MIDFEDDEFRQAMEIVQHYERLEREWREWENSPEGQAKIQRQIDDLLERYGSDESEVIIFDTRPFFDYFDSIEFPA
jgi:hypothetical protein